MVGNQWFKKEIPFMGFIGFGGGATGLGNAGAAEAWSMTGGNTNALSPGNGWTYHTFTAPGNLEVTGPAGDTIECEVFMMGGGGSGERPNSNQWSGGSACFIPETLITMADGSEKQISEIELGDVVKSEIGESTVEGIDIHVRKITVYSINDSGHFVTANHPFKTTEGWKAINPAGSLKDHGVEADRLIVGDTVLTLDGEENIVTMEAGDDVTKVYNLLLYN